jgi:hypothetical protein
LLPFAWWLRKEASEDWIRHFFTFTLIVMVIGIYFSYTRAAWLCIPFSIGGYFMIRWRLLRVLVSGCPGVCDLIRWLALV